MYIPTSMLRLVGCLWFIREALQADTWIVRGFFGTLAMGVLVSPTL